MEGGCSNRNEKDLVELSKCSIAIRKHSFPTGCMLCSLANDAWEIILTQTVETHILPATSTVMRYVNLIIQIIFADLHFILHKYVDEPR